MAHRDIHGSRQGSCHSAVAAVRVAAVGYRVGERIGAAEVLIRRVEIEAVLTPAHRRQRAIGGRAHGVGEILLRRFDVARRQEDLHRRVLVGRRGGAGSHRHLIHRRDRQIHRRGADPKLAVVDLEHEAVAAAVVAARRVNHRIVGLIDRRQGAVRGWRQDAEVQRLAARVGAGQRDRDRLVLRRGRRAAGGHRGHIVAAIDGEGDHELVGGRTGAVALEQIAADVVDALHRQFVQAVRQHAVRKLQRQVVAGI